MPPSTAIPYGPPRGTTLQSASTSATNPTAATNADDPPLMGQTRPVVRCAYRGITHALGVAGHQPIRGPDGRWWPVLEAASRLVAVCHRGDGRCRDPELPPPITEKLRTLRGRGSLARARLFLSPHQWGSAVDPARAARLPALGAGQTGFRPGAGKVPHGPGAQPAPGRSLAPSRARACAAAIDPPRARPRHGDALHPGPVLDALCRRDEAAGPGVAGPARRTLCAAGLVADEPRAKVPGDGHVQTGRPGRSGRRRHLPASPGQTNDGPGRRVGEPMDRPGRRRPGGLSPSRGPKRFHLLCPRGTARNGRRGRGPGAVRLAGLAGAGHCDEHPGTVRTAACRGLDGHVGRPGRRQHGDDRRAVARRRAVPAVG